MMQTTHPRDAQPRAGLIEEPTEPQEETPSNHAQTQDTMNMKHFKYRYTAKQHELMICSAVRGLEQLGAIMGDTQDRLGDTELTCHVPDYYLNTPLQQPDILRSAITAELITELERYCHDFALDTFTVQRAFDRLRAMQVAANAPNSPYVQDLKAQQAATGAAQGPSTFAPVAVAAPIITHVYPDGTRLSQAEYDACGGRLANLAGHPQQLAVAAAMRRTPSQEGVSQTA